MTVRFPRPGDAARSHKQRLEVLEQRSRGAQQEDAQGGWIEWEVLFDFGGGTDRSDKYSPAWTCELVEVFATLIDDGSTDTDVDLFISGGAQGTLTIPATDDRALMTVRLGLERRVHDVQFEATLGTGAGGLLVHALFRRRP
jgi:hypothetical protein